MLIHPTAIIDPKAELHETVEVGPGAIIEKGVKIGAGSRVMAHAYIDGNTTIGENNVIHIGAVIGHEPQHTGYDGRPRFTTIGDGNTFREYMTINGSFEEGGATTIGNNCFLMANSHIAHDCHIANRVILANCAMVGGHASIADGCFLSGNAAIHQFTRVGRLVMVQGQGATSQDVPPFVIMRGINQVAGLNLVGMKRAGMDSATRASIKKAYRIMYREGNSIATAIEKLKDLDQTPEIKEITIFLEETKRGVCWNT